MCGWERKQNDTDYYDRFTKRLDAGQPDETELLIRGHDMDKALVHQMIKHGHYGKTAHKETANLKNEFCFICTEKLT
jgi:hypothetical protein